MTKAFPWKLGVRFVCINFSSFFNALDLPNLANPKLHRKAAEHKVLDFVSSFFLLLGDISAGQA